MSLSKCYYNYIIILGKDQKVKINIICTIKLKNKYKYVFLNGKASYYRKKAVLGA
jgi:hypothetical protein